MKLGISYTVFDGIELLEYSIKQIREHVDFIHVAYQDISWFGLPILQEDRETLDRLHRKKLIDSLEKFSNFKNLGKVDTRKIGTSKLFERKKRQFGLNACLNKGCTHFMSMDVDEFYKAGEFAAAKQMIIDEDLSLTSCRFINYVNLPIYHRGYDTATVPFICKIGSKSKMVKGFFTRCDPTRGMTKMVKGKNLKIPSNVITMHHMETVRKDLYRKYSSTTRSIFQRNKTAQLVNSIKSVGPKVKKIDFKKIIFPSLKTIALEECDNFFKIPYSTWINKR